MSGRGAVLSSGCSVQRSTDVIAAVAYNQHDDPEGSLRHIAEHGITQEEVV